MKARIVVTVKPDVLDPQGKAIEGALHALGLEGIANVRQGKIFDITLDGVDPHKAQVLLQDASEKLLANVLVEDYVILQD